ncbi:hypothetical protein D3C84_953820 [compost metagenome]
MRGQDDLNRPQACRWLGRGLKKLHQLELALRVQMRFWLFDEEQRKSVRLLTQQQ